MSGEKAATNNNTDRNACAVPYKNLCQRWERRLLRRRRKTKAWGEGDNKTIWGSINISEFIFLRKLDFSGIISIYYCRVFILASMPSSLTWSTNVFPFCFLSFPSAPTTRVNDCFWKGLSWGNGMEDETDCIKGSIIQDQVGIHIEEKLEASVDCDHHLDQLNIPKPLHLENEISRSFQQFHFQLCFI